MKDYDGPKDDIIVFALSAKRHSIPLTLCNDRPYGYIMPPLDEGSSLEDDYANLVNLRIESISSHDPKLLPFISKLNYYVRRPLMNDTLGVDHVYTINLERRPDRRGVWSLCTWSWE
ncbi:Uncharacterized protein FKW44_017534 [Caligus rogercresseyi]|uniref:Uncharacterized protein n=1 Tax=Caligus rogercresseyi TaxID=217165 RepID=A0A7T8GT26_CALRO|nr:Uncharacterized protein FKW44_017534 [Caligus rogercresseyi]